MNITIKVIPHKKQRYPTVGDWYYTKTGLQIRISKMGNWKYEMAVAIHELIEVLLCRLSKVSQKKVDKFDIAYEKKRKKGDVSEPGDQFEAPYFKQHQYATYIERLFIAMCNEKWKDYEEKVNSL